MRDILEDFKKGKLTLEEAERLLKMDFIHCSDVAKLDINRKHRTGVPEVVVTEDKTLEDTIEITKNFLDKNSRVVLTRIPASYNAELEKIEGSVVEYHPKSKVSVVFRKDSPPPPKTGGKVGIITAGTSDIPVAEEARIIVEECGCEAHTAYDVGVAGIHRLFPSLEDMIKKGMDVFIVAAGREGALPTLIAGVVDAPVIGIPISSGYGKAGKGESALYAMLQSCSPLTVVNIDAGFTAGAVAAQIANKIANARKNNATE
ncbi:MAG: nickel pincer cofactor biosynthesis protein LarB [Thermoplasmata archaeon]|nr:MAG: nickel pincer cofactor biosynthesis protein LarB [Thermoplasmata archaeon]